MWDADKPTLKAWPNGARIAVMVTVLYEAWSDGEVPTHSPMVLASPLRPGTPDLQGVSWAEYGGKTGVWRILDILARWGIQATFCTSARAVECYPASIEAIHAAGHEVAAHAYVQDDVMPYLSLEQEIELIDRCTDTIAGAVGQRPTGWISPRATATPHTAGLLAQRGYRWHGDYNDTDLPYVLNTPAGSLVALMHSDFTDIRVIRGSPRDFLDVHRDSFDFLYNSSKPEIVNLSLHTHFGGRPVIASMFAQILDYFRRFGRVWFARHDELADWIRSASAALPAGQG